jgi:hypothetical protein
VEGDPLPFEKPEYYQARRVRDRFTDAMLEEYCRALGIDLFNENFYGPRFGILRDMRPLPPGTPQETYQSLQQRHAPKA